MPLGHVAQEEDDAGGEGQQEDDQHQVPPNTLVKAFETAKRQSLRFLQSRKNYKNQNVTGDCLSMLLASRMQQSYEINCSIEAQVLSSKRRGNEQDRHMSPSE